MFVPLIFNLNFSQKFNFKNIITIKLGFEKLKKEGDREKTVAVGEPARMPVAPPIHCSDLFFLSFLLDLLLLFILPLNLRFSSLCVCHLMSFLFYTKSIHSSIWAEMSKPHSSAHLVIETPPLIIASLVFYFCFIILFSLSHGLFFGPIFL